jgi:hypothetical protein
MGTGDYCGSNVPRLSIGTYANLHISPITCLSAQSFYGIFINYGKIKADVKWLTQFHHFYGIIRTDFDTCLCIVASFWF